MSIKSRLRSLEKQAHMDEGRCPYCQPLTLVVYCQDSPDAEPVLERGEEYPEP